MTAQRSKIINLPYATRAVLFDLDNTLYSREKAFRGWAQAFVQAHLLADNTHNPDELLKHLIHLDNYGFTARPLFFGQLRESYPHIHTPVEQLVTAYRQELSLYIIPDESTSTLLHALQSTNIPFGIVTNGSQQHQQLKIEQLKLDQFTTCIFISETFGVKKPDPAIFLAAAACLKMPPEQVLFVGDHPHADIWGAHAVGMRTVWLQQSLPWLDHIPADAADLTASTLDELYTILCG